MLPEVLQGSAGEGSSEIESEAKLTSMKMKIWVDNLLCALVLLSYGTRIVRLRRAQVLQLELCATECDVSVRQRFRCLERNHVDDKSLAGLM